MHPSVILKFSPKHIEDKYTKTASCCCARVQYIHFTDKYIWQCRSLFAPLAHRIVANKWTLWLAQTFAHRPVPLLQMPIACESGWMNTIWLGGKCLPPRPACTYAATSRCIPSTILYTQLVSLLDSHHPGRPCGHRSQSPSFYNRLPFAAYPCCCTREQYKAHTHIRIYPPPHTVYLVVLFILLQRMMRCAFVKRKHIT